MDGLMEDYVANFLKMKIENRELRKLSNVMKQITHHRKLGFDVVIDHNKCQTNEGLEQLAKICFHSLCGKFAQRSTLSSYHCVKDYPQLIQKLNDPATKSKNWHVIIEDCVELRYEALAYYTIEADYISELTAVFTNANARMRLYAMLQWLDTSQVCQYDTASVMLVYDPKNKDHKEPINDKPDCVLPKVIKFAKHKEGGLGDWEKETDEGDCVVELVVGSAKRVTPREHTRVISL